MQPFTDIQKSIAALILAVFIYSFPVSAAEKVQFDSSSTYNEKNVTLTGELSFPKKKASHPVVILLHGCGGLRGAAMNSIRQHANKLNKNGFATLILDSFDPRKNSGGWVCERISRLAHARVYRAEDTLDAIMFLKNRNDIDGENIFLMGRSNGGSTAATLANKTGKIRAITAYYPWCGVVPTKPSLPLLVLSGAEDDWTPPADCKNREGYSSNLTVTVYPNAVHSFDLDIPVITYKGHKVGGNPAALQKSSVAMISFFKKHLKR